MKLISFDVETRGVDVGYGLQPARAENGEAWLTMCAMANDKGAMGYMKPTANQLRQWLNRCAETKTNIVAWNAPFDMAWLIAMGLREEVFANKWLDAMLLWKHLTNSPEWSTLGPKSYSLKAAVAEFLPHEAGYEQDINFETDDPEELAALFEYNKKDASFTYALTQKFLGEMTEKQKRSALLEAVCLPMVAESFVQGVTIDVEAAEKLRKKLTEDADVALVTLKLQTCDQDIDESVIASPTKLRKVLYENWGLKAPKQTPKGADSTDRDALSQLAVVDNRAKLLNDHREAKNNCTKFAEGALRSAEYNGDNIARPQPRVFGTYTGRMTYSSKVGRGKSERQSGIALHQWKRAADFRDIITVPDGYTLMEFDFSGQEFRWMAVQSGDEQMLQLCMPGEDAHAYMGSRVSKEDYRRFCKLYAEKVAGYKDKRQLGKVANLSLQYRTSAKTLVTVARVQYGLTLTPKEAEIIHGTYITSYPRVSEYWRNQIKRAKQDGWVETITGRRIHVGTEDEWFRLVPSKEEDGSYVEIDNSWKATSTSINFPIQGSGADQKYLALAILKNKLSEFDGHFYFELHDGVYMIIPDKNVERAFVEIGKCLSNLPYKQAWGVDLPILFPVDGKIGKSWGTMYEPEF